MKKFFKKNGWRKKSLAFSLIEVLISMSFLTLIIGGVTLFGVRTIQAHTRSQAMQSALENARFAIESISKMARTSEITGDEGVTNTLIFTSNVDDPPLSYTYSFNADTKTLNFQGSQLVGDGGKIKINGYFDIKKNNFDATPGNKKRGFVAIVMTITYNVGGNSTESDSITIRSGVSTRY